MSGYTKLFSDIVESSLWRESPHICKVWITLLALSDSEGFIRGSEGWLALRCNLDLKVCREALEKFQKPDVHSRTPDNEGRRIEKTPDGWVILNYVFYREQTGHQLSSDHRRTYQREWMRKKRECQQLSTAVNRCKPSASASASVDASGSSPKEGMQGESDFDLFWKAYPRKTGKDAARKSWDKRTDRPALTVILAKIAELSATEQWTKDGGQFIPMPATWLNQGRWADEPTAITQRKRCSI